MRLPTIVCLAAVAGLTSAATQDFKRNNGFDPNQFDNNQFDNNNGNNFELFLNPDNVQTGSQSDGQDDSAEDGQAPSLTDNANFINFCTGKTVTNGLQQSGGSCNGIVMGDIPSQGQMVSSMIISPQPGEDIPADTDFTITVQVANLQAGSFTNPDNTYYAAPQQLNNGAVVGHTHVTVQDMGGTFTPDFALDASKFAFFKGINDDGNGQGLLSADVAGGLPSGVYRVCTMSSASNHQPVLMPVAQRGAQDDCTKFTVGQSGSSSSDNNGFDNSNNGFDNSNNGFDNNGFNNGFNGFNGTKRKRAGKFSERKFIA